MEQPNLHGSGTLEGFRKYTTHLAATHNIKQLKDVADEMAAKYVTLWNLDRELHEDTTPGI